MEQDVIERDVEEQKFKKKGGIVTFLIVLLLFIGIAGVAVHLLDINWMYVLTGNLDVQNIEVNKYNLDTNYANYSIYIDRTIRNDSIVCYFSKDSVISQDDTCVGIAGEGCNVELPLDNYYIILANTKGKVLCTKKTTDFINKNVCLKANLDEMYIAVGGNRDVNVEAISIGTVSTNIKWSSSDDDIATVEDGRVYGKSDGTVNIIAKDQYGNTTSIKVTVTSLIDSEVNIDNKPMLGNGVYTLEEANLLDKILESRVIEAGIGTRAGAVAAARFLTLEFHYAIPYFFENGRVNDSGTSFTDGEGRYYHKGLYLHKSKFESIAASFSGPAIWGAPLMNYENAGRRYIKYTRMPNGLDCSGFVSWALLNGGFDPGDYGAGENPEIDNQMTDLGDFVPITPELLDSGKVKTGDLINIWGHIGIIIGIDDDCYYVAETLHTFTKLSVKKYTKETIGKSFEYIVLMDSYYKNDGNYTKMWE